MRLFSQTLAPGGPIRDAVPGNALVSGKVAAAGLDTVAREPIEADNPLQIAASAFFTPYISWAALECRGRLKDAAIGNVRAFLEGKPRNVVNGLRLRHAPGPQVMSLGKGRSRCAQNNRTEGQQP